MYKIVQMMDMVTIENLIRKSRNILVKGIGTEEGRWVHDEIGAQDPEGALER